MYILGIHGIEEYARRCKWTGPVGYGIPLWNWIPAGSWHCTSFDSWDIGRNS